MSAPRSVATRDCSCGPQRLALARGCQSVCYTVLYMFPQAARLKYGSFRSVSLMLVFRNARCRAVMQRHVHMHTATVL